MQQGAFYTYPIGEKLEHTSIWMTPRSREWLQQTAKNSGMSQALVIDTLIRDIQLRQAEETPSKFTYSYVNQRAEVNKLLTFIQK